MSEVLTFNTTADTLTEFKPLLLYNEKNPLLKMKLPIFDFSAPPVNPQILAKHLQVTMKHYHGLGLAANQVGLQYRVFVLEGDIVCFNPRIVSTSDLMTHDSEGCLSFPGLWLRVYRPAQISVKYYDASGQLQQQEFSGITARCFQHELDHMNGILYTELVGPLTLQMARKKQQKLFKKIERIKTFKIK